MKIINKENRINEEMISDKVRVIDEKGMQLNIMLLKEALKISREKGYDLVEISPNSVPPVCKIMNYGKYKFDQARKEKEAKKKQKIVQVKEVKMRLSIEEHDFKIKIKNIEKFINDGNKVKVTFILRGRETNYPEMYKKLYEKMINCISNKVAIEKTPKYEGKNMVIILTKNKN